MTPLDTPRQSTHVAFLVRTILAWAMCWGLPAQPTAMAQKSLAHESLSSRHRPIPVLDFDSYTPSLKPQAKQLARERWKFLNREALVLSAGTYADNRVMFPLGRADRMYYFASASAQGPMSKKLRP